MRKAFTVDACIRAVLSLHRVFELPDVREAMDQRVRSAYNADIDLGAHPNVLQVKLAEPLGRYLGRVTLPDEQRLQMTYDFPERLSWSLLVTAETGVTLALIVGIVLPDSVQATDAQGRLDKIEQQLSRLKRLPTSHQSMRHPALRR